MAPAERDVGKKLYATLVYGPGASFDTSALFDTSAEAFAEAEELAAKTIRRVDVVEITTVGWRKNAGVIQGYGG
jgi:hypothetical protein